MTGLGPRVRAIAVDRGGLIALCAFVAYAAFASPHIVDGDSAEFATLDALGGRAHPSGYPLYVLWLRAWSWLPGATPAHTAAIATAILGALAVAVLHAACRAWGARPLAASAAVAIFAAAPVVLRYHAEAEVFAMNHLVVALVVWLAADAGPLRGRWRAAALGLVAGAGLANHLTCVLVAPIGLYGVVRAARESRVTAYGLAAVGLVVGLLPYAYLAVADGPASWGAIDAPGDLLAFILRSDYGGATGFRAEGADVSWTTSVAACLVTVGRSWLWAGAAGGVAMLAVRIWRPAGASRWAWALLAASFVLAGPVLATRFNVEPRGLGRYICERFHLLPALLLAIPVAALLDATAARVARLAAAARPDVAATGSDGIARSGGGAAGPDDVDRPDVTASQGRLVRPSVATLLVVVGFAALVLAGWPRLARLHSPAMELGVSNLLRSLPRDAIVVVLGDDHCLGGRYLQLVAGERPDVALVCAGMLSRPWYRAAWARRGLDLPATFGARLGAMLLATGRPVLVDPHFGGIVAAFPSYTFGIVRRVVASPAGVPSAGDVAVLNRELYRSFDLDYPHPAEDDDYASVAHHRYAESWAMIAKLLGTAGDRDAVRDALDVARSLLPTRDE